MFSRNRKPLRLGDHEIKFHQTGLALKSFKRPGSLSFGLLNNIRNQPDAGFALRRAKYILST
jgi:hypothetical protein